MDDKLLTIILHQYDQIAGGYIILLRTVCGCVTGTKVELLKGLLPVGNENMRTECGEPFYNKMSKIYGDMICIWKWGKIMNMTYRHIETQYKNRTNRMITSKVIGLEIADKKYVHNHISL